MPLVLTSVADGVGTLTLNNPDERNTLTAPMVAEIVAAVDAFEADESVGAIVVTGTPPAFCAGANLGNLRTADGASLGNVYEGFLRVARSHAADAGRGQRGGGRRGDEHGPRLRRPHRRPPGPLRHPVPADRHPPGGRAPWMLRRIVGPQTAMATVLFGEVLDGAEAERVGMVYRCVDDDALLETAQDIAARAASAPRELLIRTKQTIQAMAEVDDHPTAVARELDPQVWSLRQPWFEERIAALQARISKKA